MGEPDRIDDDGGHPVGQSVGASDAVRADGPVVVFMPSAATSWSRMLPQIEATAQRSPFTPVVLLTTAAVHEFADICQSKGFRHLAIGPFERQDRGHFPAMARRWRRLMTRFPVLKPLERLASRDRIAHSLPVSLLRLRQTRRRLSGESEAFLEVFRELDPIALFTQGDRELGPVPPAIKAARTLNIPIVIAAPGVPSVKAMSAIRRGQPRFYSRLRQMPPLLNLWVARTNPAQERKTEHGHKLFSPGWLALALKAEGMLSENPWCQGGGRSNFVLMDGERKKELFRAQGVADEKLVVIGDLDLDPLHQATGNARMLRHELMLKYALDQRRPLYVFAVPIYAEHGAMSWPAHLAALERHAAALGERNVNVLLSLHPKSQRDSYQDIAARYGFAFAEERLMSLLPAADLFLCGSSSTIEWAVLCQTPTVNIDYAGINDSAFESYRGVIRVSDAAELRRVLARLADEPDWHAQLAAAQKEAAPGLSLFDGRASDRFVTFLQRLAHRRSEAAALAGAAQ